MSQTDEGVAMSQTNTLIQKLLSADVALDPGALPYPVLIYGAGKTGQGLAVALKTHGYVVTGFLDAQAGTGQRLENLPVCTLDDWLLKNEPSNHHVIVAIDRASLLPEVPGIIEALRASFHRVSWYVYDCFRLGWENDPVMCPSPSWETVYAASADELDRLRLLLADEKSRHCLGDYIHARCQELPMQFVDPDQYHPQDLPAWPNPLRFIDCGAYTGDTLEDFAQQGYEFEAIVAFEPHPVSFPQLVQNARHYPNIVNLPLAVGSKTESMCFEEIEDLPTWFRTSPRNGEGRGDKNIQCVRLDEVLPTFAPNLIKMDIEGGELEALQGAERMIARHRPGLAICIYHRPKHLWEIPFLIDSWNLGYRFYIRQHHFYFETILYAYPDKNHEE
jgi:FkbM family methyltransferase